MVLSPKFNYSNKQKRQQKKSEKIAVKLVQLRPNQNNRKLKHSSKQNKTQKQFWYKQMKQGNSEKSNQNFSESQSNKDN